MKYASEATSDAVLRILILDDVATDAELVERELRRAGVEFVADRAGTKEAFLRALERFPPDIVLADYSMPDFGAMAALEILKKQAPLTPLIVVTGAVTEETAVGSMKAGAADYVLKDHLVRLPSAVRTALYMKRDREVLKRGEEERELLYGAVEQASNFIVITDAEGTIEYVNPAFERITGYSPNEAIGNNPRMLKSGKHDAAFYQAMWGALTSGDAWTGEFTNKRKNGTLYKHRAVISPVRDESGTTVKYVAVGKDVTKERELEAQLRQAQKMEAVGELTGGIAHDFNNLLTVIIANTEIVMASLSDDSGDLGAAVSDVRAAADNGARMVKRLLGYSRNADLEMTTTDLSKVVGGMSSMLQRVIPANIHIEVATDDSVKLVSADSGAVEQVILNLATNARDAMPDGGTLELTVQNVDVNDSLSTKPAWLQPGEYVLVSARDTGIGMDEATRRKIFEPFFTTKAAGRGTGLGMAMVYGLMKQHDGYVTVDSEPGQGTTINLYFPALSNVAFVAESNSPEAAKEVRGGTEKILLVEDEDSLRRVGARILKASGYTVVEAANGRDAIECYGDHAPTIDLVVSDLIMPDMGGMELCHAFRDTGDMVPFVLTTGYAPGDLRDMGLSCSDVTTVQKPWTIDELLQTVRSALDGRLQGHSPRTDSKSGGSLP